jgi:translation initiation factor 4A
MIIIIMSNHTQQNQQYPHGEAAAAAAAGGVTSPDQGQGIDLDNMYQDPDIEIMLTSEPDIGMINSFDQLPIAENILQGVYGHGFERPSHVQQKGIMPILNGRDLICQFPSGSGKTGTFVIGILGRINWESSALQAVIIAPTRELARQIHTVAVSLSRHIPGASTYLAIGGNAVVRKYDTARTAETVPSSQIVVGTPGRIIDFIQRGHLNTEMLRIVCFDEADEMFSMGFRDQVRQIIHATTASTQILLFSATIPPELIEMIHEKRIMNNPLKILIKPDNVKLDGIKQYYVSVADKHKYETLLDLFRDLNISQAIIYCNSKERVEWLVGHLLESNFPVDCVYSCMTQDQRNEVIRRFRAGEVRILIATDLIARGLDVQQVSVVINYDFPKDAETYIHRSGRSGRFGKKGLCINFVDRRDHIYMRSTMQQYQLNIEPLRSDIGAI